MSPLSPLVHPDLWLHKLRNFSHGAASRDEVANLVAIVVTELDAALRHIDVRRSPRIELTDFRPKKSRICTLTILLAAKDTPTRRKRYRVEIGDRYIEVGDEVIPVATPTGPMIFVRVLVREITKFLQETE